MSGYTQEEIDAINVEMQQTEGYDEYIQSLKDQQDREIQEYIDAHKNKEILKSATEMTKIENKKFITTKQFQEKYNISISSQADFRGRTHDPLPFHQRKLGCKITYNVDEVEKWFKNNNRNR